MRNTHRETYTRITSGIYDKDTKTKTNNGRSRLTCVFRRVGVVHDVPQKICPLLPRTRGTPSLSARVCVYVYECVCVCARPRARVARKRENFV